MDFLERFVQTCLTLVIPLLAIMILSVILSLLGLTGAAYAVSLGGTILVMFGNCVYILHLERRKAR